MGFLVWPRAHGEEIENIALGMERRGEHVETVREVGSLELRPLNST